MSTRLISEPSPNGFVFRLVRDKAIGARVNVPVRDWIVEVGSEGVPGVSVLLAWLDEENAIADGETVIVEHARVAGIDSNTAHALAVAPPPPYVLDVQHIGTINLSEFRFKTTWLQPNGQGVPGARRQGGALIVGGRHYRIPEPLFGIVEACDAFNAAASTSDLDERFRLWAKMSKLLPSETERSIKVDGYLSSTRVAHASSFSLSLHSGAQGFSFDPVLFGADFIRGAADDNELVQHELEGLLPPAQQALFSRSRFLESDDCRAHYALGDGWYVVLDEPVRQALSVVRRAQKADAETRKQFVRNPRSFLAKSLGESIPESILEAVFVETAEYSGRVTDVGVWQPKVLPWIKKPPEEWIPPETFGIRIGTKTITVSAKEIPVLQDLVLAAIAQKAESVAWHDVSVPATSETLAALNMLVGEVGPPRTDGTDSPGLKEEGRDFVHDQPQTSAQYVLEIYDHFSEIGYQKGRQKRSFLPEAGVPTRLKTALKPHQVEGLHWLQRAWSSGLSGVLLADDMGLGKTLQALTFLAWLREAMEQGRPRTSPLLIVAPTGLLKNWEQEHDRHLHLPGLGQVVRAFGPELATLRTQRGREVELGEATLDSDRLVRADWILTTYETLRDYQHSFCSIRYGAVVFDEMQKIKTPGIALTDAAKALNADFIIGMTGTPVENRLADLWCLVDTLQPGLLKDLASFSRQYEKDVSSDDLRYLKAELCDPSADTPQIMMRRMKADKLPGLPPKIEHLLEEPMSGAQATEYDEAIKSARAGGERGKMLETLHRLRSISLHPFHPSTATDDSYVNASARFALTVGILDDIADKGEKALIFLESQEMQPCLAALLQRRYRLEVMPMLINGTVSGPKRQQRVDIFQSNPKGFDVIILSPRAGGVGLTLTAANHVIHLSRWWNPAVEDQCTDRVHRIGQRANEVHVYYPLAVHPSYGDQSFDHRLNALLEKRRLLSRELLLPPVDPSDTKDLFEQTVGGETGSGVDLSQIDCMEPIEFENWVLGRLRDEGHRVSKTPRTRDGGADGIAYHRLSGRPYLIQCKHTQGSTSPDEAVSDLIRAKAAYSNLRDAGAIAVTNSASFGSAAIKRAVGEGMVLVSRARLGSWPIDLE